ncbi:MAG: hypothetical protein IPN94_22630 [Sphingobacteriales bacterium]|nr:hypothetical protein [Sphingobacteriales bacterium]
MAYSKGSPLGVLAVTVTVDVASLQSMFMLDIVGASGLIIEMLWVAVLLLASVMVRV